MNQRPLSWLAAAISLAATLPAQTHRATRPDAVTRAVAVYEYSGDLAHPKAARLIPVSLFLGGHFEDAGVYLARPVPLALDNGNVYEFQQAGTRLGYLDLAFAKNYNANAAGAAIANNFENGWFGYGRYRALPTPKAAKVLTARNNNAHVVTDSPDGRPVPAAKPDGKPDPSAGPLPRGADDDPDRPAKISLPDDTSSRKSDTPDPDRPTLHRQTGPPPPASSDGSSAPPTGKNGKPPKPPNAVVVATGDPSTDPDRPSMRRHRADENVIPPDPVDLPSTKGLSGPADTVTGGPAIDNPNRPSLRRGRQSAQANGAAGESLLPMQAATPVNDLAQTAAVSDAKDRPEHSFLFPFASDTDRTTILREMEALAQEVLAHPSLATDAPDILKKEAASFKPAQPTVERRPMRTGNTAVRQMHALTRPATPAESSHPELAGEQLSAFQLSYSAEPTYVFTAHTSPSAAPLRYATVVAQLNTDGKLSVAMRTTTDVEHLDRVPRYRLIDAVDADGSNRASLLFELRAQHSRQFALYRLLGPHPDQIFVSGSTL